MGQKDDAEADVLVCRSQLHQGVAAPPLPVVQLVPCSPQHLLQPSELLLLALGEGENEPHNPLAPLLRETGLVLGRKERRRQKEWSSRKSRTREEQEQDKGAAGAGGRSYNLISHGVGNAILVRSVPIVPLDRTRSSVLYQADDGAWAGETNFAHVPRPTRGYDAHADAGSDVHADE
eukprot:753200-Hanusia_phi.AAC.2